MLVLLAGWFSIDGGGATAGDLLVRDLICDWLRREQIPYELAQEPTLGDGVDWFRVAPQRYTHFLFACGPVARELPVGDLIERFARCRRVGVNVSLLGDPPWQPFDLLIERDGPQRARADLAVAAPIETAPVVALVRTTPQLEYPTSRPQDAHGAFDRLLAGREAAVYAVDTILDANVPGRRSTSEVTALIGRADLVLTTRLHGLVLALSQSIPVVALDSVPGGAKVIAQARALGWPAAMTVDELDEEKLADHYDWCLTPEAREHARDSALAGATEVEQTRRLLADYLARG